MNEKPGFIVFEGGEGTGKTTQSRLLASTLQRTGRAAVVGREPGGPPGAEALRRMLLESPLAGVWEPESEVLLHYAARAEHLKKVIAPALAAGSWVVCDRYADSTEAYQGAGLALQPEMLGLLRRMVVGKFEPDLVLVLDLDPATGLGRAGQRANRPDHYERMDLAFHQRVRAAFLDIARRDSDRYAVIDATDRIEAVEAVVRNAVERRFGLTLRT